MIDPQRPVPYAILEARLASLRGWMVAQGLEALVVFGLGSVLGTATRSHGNLRYLLDWDADAAPSALVLTPNGPLAIVVGNIFSSLWGQERGWIPTIRMAKGPGFAKAVLDLLPSGAARVGLTGRDEIPLGIWDTLAASGAGGWLDCSGELARRRAIKDAVQIGYHREAAKICDAIFAHLGPTLHSGRPVFEVQAELERLGRALGCELCRTWLTVMPVADRCRYWRDENRNTPQPGDQVLLGIMLILHGHWGHALRTGTMGPAGAAAKEMFAAVQGLHSAMLAALRPGADLRAVGNAGLVPPQPGTFQFRSGHALGHSYEDVIGTAEFPQPYDGSTTPDTPRLAEPGMLFEVHPNLFVEGVGGAAIGDMVLVTQTGTDVLTAFPSGLIEF